MGKPDHSLASIQTLECKSCGVTCKSSGELRRHYKNHAPTRATFDCPEPGCDKQFGYAKDLRRHELTHSPMKINCLICEKTYTRLDNLRRHQRQEHPFKDSPPDYHTSLRGSASKPVHVRSSIRVRDRPITNNAEPVQELLFVDYEQELDGVNETDEAEKTSNRTDTSIQAQNQKDRQIPVEREASGTAAAWLCNSTSPHVTSGLEGDLVTSEDEGWIFVDHVRNLEASSPSFPWLFPWLNEASSPSFPWLSPNSRRRELAAVLADADEKLACIAEDSDARKPSSDSRSGNGGQLLHRPLVDLISKPSNNFEQPESPENSETNDAVDSHSPNGTGNSDEGSGEAPVDGDQHSSDSNNDKDKNRGDDGDEAGKNKSGADDGNDEGNNTAGGEGGEDGGQGQPDDEEKIANALESIDGDACCLLDLLPLTKGKTPSPLTCSTSCQTVHKWFSDLV